MDRLWSHQIIPPAGARKTFRIVAVPALLCCQLLFYQQHFIGQRCCNQDRATDIPSVIEISPDAGIQYVSVKNECLFSSLFLIPKRSLDEPLVFHELHTAHLPNVFEDKHVVGARHAGKDNNPQRRKANNRTGRNELMSASYIRLRIFT